METADLERMARENAARRKEWDFRATLYHDVALPSGTWAVDGEVQDADLTEDSLLAAVNAKAPAKPEVTVGAPLHLVIGRIVGYTPPYKHAVA